MRPFKSSSSPKNEASAKKVNIDDFFESEKGNLQKHPSQLSVIYHPDAYSQENAVNRDARQSELHQHRLQKGILVSLILIVSLCFLGLIISITGALYFQNHIPHNVTKGGERKVGSASTLLGEIVRENASSSSKMTAQTLPSYYYVESDDIEVSSSTIEPSPPSLSTTMKSSIKEEMKNIRESESNGQNLFNTPVVFRINEDESTGNIRIDDDSYDKQSVSSNHDDMNLYGRRIDDEMTTNIDDSIRGNGNKQTIEEPDDFIEHMEQMSGPPTMLDILKYVRRILNLPRVQLHYDNK